MLNLQSEGIRVTGGREPERTKMSSVHSVEKTHHLPAAQMAKFCDCIRLCLVLYEIDIDSVLYLES